MQARTEIDFEDVFKKHYKPIFAFFFSQGAHSEDCQDLAQETFLRLFRSQEDFRGETSIRRWLRQIAINVWRNELRRRRAKKRDVPEVSLEDILRRLAEGETYDPPDTHGQTLPAEAILAMEQARILGRCLEGLPCQMRQVAILRFVQDHKYREIASLLKISIETVKSQIFQARQRLREELDASLGSQCKSQCKEVRG